MPCSSDYMEPSGQELESQRVCKLICYVHMAQKNGTDSWIRDAACSYYGNVARLDEATQILCALCRNMSESEKEAIIYNAHDEQARSLASWFERHQEWDKRRVVEEDAARKQAIIRERALKKLSVGEMRALGLID